MEQEQIQFTNQEKPAVLEKKAEDSLASSGDQVGEGGSMPKGVLALLTFVVVFLGIFTGFVLARNRGTLFSREVKRSVSEEEIEKGTIVGVKDEKTFKDVAEGELQEGGVNGEGSHHLVRPGGESQNVYLTSSIIDLDKFSGHKVRVWGETFAAQKAGWLMDVGKLEVLE